MTVARSQPHSATDELRLLTYLAPGLPLALFEAVGAHLERALSVAVRLASDPTRSAPEPDGRDPFSRGEADVGFCCSPGYLWLEEQRPAPIELVPAAFVFDDPRCQDRPLYFADLVVRADARARSLAELEGARWVYNDPCSLSGYFSVLAALAARGADASFFASARAIGSHHAALRAIAAGEADCAAIDSNTLLLERRRGAAGGVRVIESFGPFPVQPVIARTALARARRDALATALLDMHRSPAGRAGLARAGVLRFAPITPSAYEPERALLARARRAARDDCQTQPR